MNIAICDDSNITISEISNYINEYLNLNGIKHLSCNTYTSGEQLLSGSIVPDILFLDIEMGGMNGISVGKDIKKINPDCIIIITTSYIEYLDDAMRFHVFRYLSKPLDKTRFIKNFKEALETYNSSIKKIVIETKNETITVLTKKIIMIEAYGRKVTIHTTEGVYTSIHPLSYWKTELDMPCFFQSHKSFIINFEHVTSFNHTDIKLSNNTHAYLTKRKYMAFKQSYLLYLESTR